MPEKTQSVPPKRLRRRAMLFDGIRTFSAAVGTTALLMLTLCGVIDTVFPQNEAVQTASALGTVETEPQKVQLGGELFGIRMFSDGIIVAALSDIYTDGAARCPARDAGIQAGDYVIRANGQTVSSNAQLAKTLSGGETVTLTLRRDEETFDAVVTPVFSDGHFLTGMWIRDSAAGLGTVTYYTEDGAAFGALGHGICDADTKALVTLREGEPAAIAVCGIERGRAGAPGRLRGYFIGGNSPGTLTANTGLGIFGTTNEPHTGELVEILPREDVKTGKVQIVSTIDEQGPRVFEAELERVSRDAEQTTKTLVLRITDPELLERTGGIVQGMSGSPIIQDGKLLGCLTHVFVDDPTRGYGIFIETMLDAAE